MNDEFKNQCIQFLCGEHPRLQKPYGIRSILDKEMSRHKKIYTTQNDINISVLTWNCGGNGPPSSVFKIDKVIFDESLSKSDIYIIGL